MNSFEQLSIGFFQGLSEVLEVAGEIADTIAGNFLELSYTAELIAMTLEHHSSEQPQEAEEFSPPINDIPLSENVLDMLTDSGTLLDNLKDSDSLLWLADMFELSEEQYTQLQLMEQEGTQVLFSGIFFYDQKKTRYIVQCPLTKEPVYPEVAEALVETLDQFDSKITDATFGVWLACQNPNENEIFLRSYYTSDH